MFYLREIFWSNIGTIGKGGGMTAPFVLHVTILGQNPAAIACDHHHSILVQVGGGALTLVPLHCGPIT